MTKKVKGNESFVHLSSFAYPIKGQISLFSTKFWKNKFSSKGREGVKICQVFWKIFTFLATRIVKILTDLGKFLQQLDIKFLSVKFWHLNKKCTYWKNTSLEIFWFLYLLVEEIPSFDTVDLDFLDKKFSIQKKDKHNVFIILVLFVYIFKIDQLFVK